MKDSVTRLLPALLFLLPTSNLAAQDLAEVCPDSPAGTGALFGLVSDTDAEMALPGAMVHTQWEADGKPAKADTQTGLDGSFVICYLPLDTPLSVMPMLGNMSGTPVSVTLSEPVTRLDLAFSLTGATGAAEGEVDKIWACIGEAGSTLRNQLGNMVFCDPNWPGLERCPKEELGRVSASASGGGRGRMREVIESLVDQAKRLGANALVQISGGRGSISAMAVKIEVDPASC